MSEFRPIHHIGFEHYKVNNRGDLLDCRNAIIQSVKTRLNYKGYVTMSLTSPGPYANKEGRLHQLVANAFIPNPDNLPSIDHIDRDKTNNNVSNLRWISHGNNNRNRFRSDSNSYPGVSRDSRNMHWIAQIGLNKKKIHLGSFANAFDAYQCWLTFVTDNNLAQFYPSEILNLS